MTLPAKGRHVKWRISIISTTFAARYILRGVLIAELSCALARPRSTFLNFVVHLSIHLLRLAFCDAKYQSCANRLSQNCDFGQNGGVGLGLKYITPRILKICRKIPARQPSPP